jgi:hypothetical protein
MQIDFSRLGLQWAMVAMVVYGLIATAEEGAASAAMPLAAQKPGHGRAGKKQPGDIVYSQPAVLAQAETAELRRLRFPENESLGQVLVESVEDPDYWDSVGEARGVVGISAELSVQLELRKEASVYLGSLGQPEMSAIVSLDASDSKITDDDLMWVAALSELRDLDLTNTAITDLGLSHLGRLKSLEKLWLDGTKVSDAGLSALKELANLKKVSVASTEIADSSVISLRDHAKDCQFVLSNGKNA